MYCERGTVVRREDAMNLEMAASPAVLDLGLSHFCKTSGQPVAVVSVPSGVLLETNESFDRLFGSGLNGGGEESILRLALSPTASKLERALKNWTGEEEQWIARAALRLPGGGTARARTGLLPIPGSFPSVALFQVVRGRREEVNRLRQLIDERIEQLRSLEHLRSLGEVSAVLVHEIRTPLTSIRVTLDGIRRSRPQSAQVADRLDFVRDQLDRIDHLLSSIRDFSKPVPLRYESRSLHEILGDVRATVGTRFPNLQCRTRIRPKGLEVWTDPERLKEILENLIVNAAEAMEGRGPVVLSGQESRRHSGWTEIGIKDTGPGISKENLRRVFQIFYTTKPTGAGLGLSIVKKLVDLHGGLLRLDSEPGKGTRVLLEFPPKPARRG